MSDSSAALDLDRLPWLADEVEPARGRRRPRLLPVALIPAVLLAGVSFWLGMTGSGWPELSANESPTSVSARRMTLPPANLAQRPAGQVPEAPAPVIGPVPQAAIPALAAVMPKASRPPAPAANNAGSAAAAAATPAPQPESAEAGKTDIAALDRHLALLYSQSWSKADAGKRGLLLRSHDRFVARLGNCRSDSCKSGVYLARMSEISEITTGQLKPRKALVSTAGLASLDRHLASFYGQSWDKADSAQRAMLLRTQDRFVDRLDACRSDACKSGAYLARMREVSEIMTAREQASAAEPPSARN